ncbi:MAG: dihydrolipoamide acetyltransferase family protein [Tenuifilum sp.]|uniref:dihydrolipoamide acetyltransferase family protein n=2 Tax=Tenuifilum sp. TaxID=2760880 RepID=UPI002BC9DD9D|nr:dihydrolipoamide acetyltransferase family protein [Tenuifilum sp.]HON70544.1 dihydrolipoamide acetyltransferase family protein [Tenuifilum sp.]HPP90145.1 dihydrolipoamide acetyltransferase family protein [Tenuifilum sp.]HRR11695.1 dihydrolipoamide acetyltransferase family protein [Tenuifilum sp.]HRS43985.1 dihydrolipoamide acetyltransferase family protein [Tenuifilum sp.]
MAEVKIVLPAMGEGVTEAKITKWLVKPGDLVEVDQPLVEIATDKVDSEVPSTSKGKVKQLLFNEGDSPQVGQAICILEVEGVIAEGSKTHVAPAEPKSAQKEKPIAKPIEITEKAEVKQEIKTLRYLSPLVRSMAKQENIALEELENIEGTGLDGRITKDDLLKYIENRSNRISQIEAEAKERLQTETPIQYTSSTDTNISVLAHEVVPMDRMRKLIAEHMVRSKQTSAHVASFIEVDVTNLVNWRETNKDKFQKTYGDKITLTHLFAQATIAEVKRYPLLNSSVEGDNIILKRDVNLGIATALPNGNLIVPVVKRAETLNLIGIAKSINDLAQRARDNKLKPDEIVGGTFTITNLGSFDTLTGTPIINQPQVAILAIGAVKKRPVVIETPSGDMIAIRHICILSLSYDHRVIDGALAGQFLKSLRDRLENFTPSEI